MKSVKFVFSRCKENTDSLLQKNYVLLYLKAEREEITLKQGAI